MPENSIQTLANSPLHWFREWPDPSVPNFGAGVYTIWNTEGGFVYVGMSGRSITAQSAIPNRKHGLITRLHSHFQGRRSGDQFCVYVADRFVLPTLKSEEIEAIGSGKHSLDAHVRKYIHAYLGYRFVICGDGADALALERRIRRGDWPYGQPLLNPQKV